MSPPESAMVGLRTGVAVTRLDHLCALRVSGPGAVDLLDVATSSRLFVRENQMLHTLMLDSTARIFADVFVCQDEDSWIVLADGVTAVDLLAYLDRVRGQRAPSADAHLVDLKTGHQLWGIDGPFAWELTSALLGPEVLGAPYLSFLQLKEITCFRAGKTGEFGYVLLVPDGIAPALWQRLHDRGAAFDLVEANLATLDQCALENWHFFMRAVSHAKASPAVTPLELQLQWRVNYDKDFEGVEALRERRKAGGAQRLTCFVAREAVQPMDKVRHGDREVGSVMVTGWSSTRGDWVGWALLDLKLAWPGINAFHVESATGPVPIETRSPPLIDNRSLFVDPHRHRYLTRNEEVFPPLVSS
jgi:glycine cleavage system aminomethyltransferase T